MGLCMRVWPGRTAWGCGCHLHGAVGSDALWWGVVRRMYVTLYHTTYSGSMQVASALGCWHSGGGHGLVAGQLRSRRIHCRTSGL